MRALLLLLLGFTMLCAIKAQPVRTSFEGQGFGVLRGGYFDACSAGYKFKAVDCDTWSDAPDISAESTTPSAGSCDRNYIMCDGGITRDVWDFEMAAVHGKSTSTGSDMYYASSILKRDRDTLVFRGGSTSAPASPHYDTQQFCWKRQGVNGDGCACLCVVVLKALFGNHPECQCYFM
jgi:hypothetical protein